MKYLVVLLAIAILLCAGCNDSTKHKSNNPIDSGSHDNNPPATVKDDNPVDDGGQTEQQAPPATSLYERLGGEAAIEKAVKIFYGKVLADNRVSGFFGNTDMERQIAKQKSFLTMVFGGPAEYDGEDLRAVHRHLVENGLNDSHFDAVVEHLTATVQELGASQADVDEVKKIAESVRNDVLNK